MHPFTELEFDLAYGEERWPSVEPRGPTVSDMSVSDFPENRFAYTWGLLAPSVDHLTAPACCRVVSHRMVLVPDAECLVFIALAIADEPADRRSEPIYLWTADDELTQELPLRIVTAPRRCRDREPGLLAGANRSERECGNDEGSQIRRILRLGPFGWR